MKLMKRHFFNLFIPHHGNNHKPRLLHHSSLSKLVILLLIIQLFLTGIARVKPGVLGYASNISVDQVLALTNEKRKDQGLDPLTLNPELSNSARQKAAHMFANNYWAHNAPDGTTPWAFFKNVGYNYLYAGENLARDFGDSVSVVQAWMDSPTHRDNLLSKRYNEIGIAAVNGILNGQETTLVVQHFGRQASAQAMVSGQAANNVAGINDSLKLSDNPAPKQPQANVQEPVEDVITDINNQVNVSSKNQGLESLFPANTTAGVKSMPVNYFSVFDVTKSVNLAITAIIIFVLALDGFLIWHNKTTRRSGKSFVHLALFALVSLIIILTSSGRII